jgi:integrase
LNYCKDDLKWISTTPKIRLFKESNDRVRWLTSFEVEKLVEELPHHQKPIVLFAIATGLRQSNVLKIKWSQINFELKHAYVEARNSKNRKAIPVPLNEKALEVLKDQIGKHPERVFTYKGKPFSAANTKAWSNALKRAGIEDFRWHDLRHTWASWQRQSGAQVHEIQKLGGWLTPAMVERYAHLAPDHLGDVATRIDSKFPKVTV